MRAAVIPEPGRVEIARIDDPTPGPRDVVGQVAACGVCGIDLHILQTAIEDGLQRVAKAGTFLQFGVTDYGANVRVDPYRIYNHEITITGSVAVLHSYERAAELFLDGVLDPNVFISDRLPSERDDDALDRMRRGIGRKIQVLPGNNNGKVA